MISRLTSVKICRTSLNIVHNQRRKVTDFAVTISPLTHIMGDAWTTKLCEQTLLFFHDSLHLPWWLGIIGVTLTVKTLLMPANIIAIRSASKLPYVNALLEPRLIEVEREIRRKGQEKNLSQKAIDKMVTTVIMEAKREVYIKNNCHPFRPYPFMAMQIPVWLSLTYAVRNIAVFSKNSSLFYFEQERFITETPLDFADCGFLWIPSLSSPDPYFILPILLLAVHLCNFQLKQSDTLMAPDNIKFKVPKGMKIIIPFQLCFSVFICYVVTILPSGVGLYWLISAIFQFGLSLILKYPKAKQLFKILPSPLESKNPQPMITFFKSFGRLFYRKR